MPTFTTQAIAAAVDGRLVGPGDLAITGLDTVADAGPGDLTFLGSAVYAQKWPRCKASAALVSNSSAMLLLIRPFHFRHCVDCQIDC